ncbi:imidazole glycerol phosphate synthase subunit HisH [Marinoscillum furvescens]|uniref:Imidazole glycerol phosphate synthase subunit HisH n=1 Tax=Marinoscillum furvescens DSM 4134 TaxID=1122208 RepID=A0A3D9L329_MARFU|nr:imidazole glycerol phosphate synthase subunit HisH [Marinoscillum furvescens]RED97468.1 imidazole glycerol phosphate synthase subunit HisH [Marinoscillum furvescens DSM 4134]
MKVAIVKYNAGNIQSLTFALNRLGVEPTLTDDAEELAASDKVIFPGQGEASSAMRSLQEKGLDGVIKSLKQPFLGVCLGMQLMCAHTEENDTEGLGIIPEQVKRFNNDHVKVPHMGWNDISEIKSPLFEGVSNGDYLYFVHSYYVPVGAYTIATCEYPDPFSAAIQKDNFYAIQPHPEKSADAGMQVLANFLKL